MSIFFQRNNFLWSGLSLPCVVEAKIDARQISLRTWRLSGDDKIKSVLSVDEARSIYGNHVEAFEVDSDFAGLRDIREKHWIPLEALGGEYVGGERRHNLYLQPVSQVGFKIAPDVLGSVAWSDYASWTFNCTRDGKLSFPFNRYLETQPSRQHRQVLLLSRKETNLMLLQVPFAQNDFSNCIIVLKYNPMFGCIHNLPTYRELPIIKFGLNSYDLEKVFGLKAMFPSLRITGPESIEAQCTASYTVEMFSRNTDSLVDDVETKVYLESNAGYLPQRQVEIRKGVGSFPLMALGLSPGDRIKLKVGWRNFSGADEKIVTVI